MWTGTHATRTADEPPHRLRRPGARRAVRRARRRRARRGDHDPGAPPGFARRFAAYLHAYRAAVTWDEQLERAVHQTIGVTTDAPVALAPGIFPPPRALRWFEMITGYRLRSGDGAPAALTLRSQDRSLTVPA